MVVFVSLFGPVQRVYEKLREDFSKYLKKLMKVKMKIQFKIPKKSQKIVLCSFRISVPILALEMLRLVAPVFC